MTNKLPVVGKRYRLCVGINDLDRVEYQFCEVKRLTDTAVECLVNGLQLHYYPKDTFLLAWEELPEDKAETKPETQSHISELSPEVKEAMEWLRDDIKAWIDDVFGEFIPLSRIKPLEPVPVYETLMMINDLLNALDKQFKVNEKEESIWKPVSELPKRKKNGEVLLKHKNGTIRLACLFIENYGKENAFCPIHLRGSFLKEYFTHYATVGDLFNDYEKLKERDKLKEMKLRELEERVNKLEEK